MYPRIVAVLAFSVSLSCAAQLQVHSPAQACSRLVDTQLRAGEWTQYPDGKEGCRSAARLITSDGKGTSTIAYAAEGEDGIPNRVMLVTDVLSSADAEWAKRDLIKAAKRLSVRVLGLSMPHSIDEAIMRERYARLFVGTGSITVDRTPTIKGRYQLTIVME